MTCTGIVDAVDLKQFEWEIADFFSLSTVKGHSYVSPSFVFNSIPLHLKIYPGGCPRNDTKPGFISLFLVNETTCPLHATKMMCIKQADGTFTAFRSGDAPLISSRGFLNVYDTSDLERNKSELVPSGILTIICILKLNQDGNQAVMQAKKEISLHEKETNQNSDHRILSELDSLSENFKHLSANKDSCDVVLQVQDKEFKAHKTILIARSSVFAAMFQHDTLEKQTGFIKIPDCDSESFQEFLDYLYCGKLENVSFRSAFHLYSTSNKYDVKN